MSSSVGEKPRDDAPQGHEKRRGKARCGGVKTGECKEGEKKLPWRGAFRFIGLE